MQGISESMSPSVCSDHWRKNLPVLGLKCRTFAVDLLGYGYSDKPSPKWVLALPCVNSHACGKSDLPPSSVKLHACSSQI